MLKVRPFSFWWKGFTCLKDNSHYRSSQRGCSERNGVLSNFAKFTGKHLCQSLFFNKVAGFISEKRDSGTGVSMWILCEVSKNTIFTEQLWLTASVIMRRQTFLIRLISLKKIMQWVKSRKKMSIAFYV